MQKIIVLVVIVTCASGATYEKRLIMEDQGTAESGYVYHSNGPITIKSFLQEQGGEYNGEKHAKHGEKDANGYKTIEEFSEGSKGEHNKENEKGSYNQAGGDKETSHETSENHESEYETGGNSNGVSFGEETSHKKGSKTTGYHKIYKKDEFKKDHTFYDVADSRGTYDKHGNFHSYRSSDTGNWKKGGNAEKAHQENEQGIKAEYDQGQHNNEKSGRESTEGGEERHSNQTEQAEKNASEDHKSYGYKSQ